MFFEKMFGSLFGLIWLVIFIVAVFVLLIREIVRKEKVIKIEKELLKEVYKKNIIEENEEGLFEIKKEDGSIVKTFSTFEDCKVFIDVLLLRKEEVSSYEIVEADGFFKVRKIGSSRTIRKFDTEEEAEMYVKEKESND